MAGVMEGRRVLITGARNKWSIAWHAALSLHREGARLAFSVLSDREAGDVAKLLNGASIEAPILTCDAADDAQVSQMFQQVGDAFDGQLDGLLHAMAHANREDLRGEFVATSREGFQLAHSISAYTFVSLARGARPLLQAAGGGSLVTLSYLGADRAIPNYNVMGAAKASLEACTRYLAADLGKDNIRVNAVSAAPIKTLSASGIAEFDTMRKLAAERSPLGRRIEGEEVGDAILFLLSPWARAITGETIYVDGGYHITGM